MPTPRSKTTTRKPADKDVEPDTEPKKAQGSDAYPEPPVVEPTEPPAVDASDLLDIETLPIPDGQSDRASEAKAARTIAEQSYMDNEARRSARSTANPEN
ncbi:MAG: hypothetical protein ITG02_01200 [Patulibacter sp.]|nr:hypothetical protein [Patulibacter sp.]